jgi:hypothetical protein
MLIFSVLTESSDLDQALTSEQGLREKNTVEEESGLSSEIIDCLRLHKRIFIRR